MTDQNCFPFSDKNVVREYKEKAKTSALFFMFHVKSQFWSFWGIFNLVKVMSRGKNEFGYFVRALTISEYSNLGKG